MVKPVSMKDGDFHLWGPFYSHAYQAFKVEYYEHDSKRPGESWQSAFYCKKEEDAKRLHEAAQRVTNRAEWLALRDEAMRLARESDGFIYRVMAGETESFTKGV